MTWAERFEGNVELRRVERTEIGSYPHLTAFRLITGGIRTSLFFGRRWCLDPVRKRDDWESLLSVIDVGNAASNPSRMHAAMVERFEALAALEEANDV